jgi:hypothetical protein
LIERPFSDWKDFVGDFEVESGIGEPTRPIHWNEWISVELRFRSFGIPFVIVDGKVTEKETEFV